MNHADFSDPLIFLYCHHVNDISVFWWGIFVVQEGRITMILVIHWLKSSTTSRSKQLANRCADIFMVLPRWCRYSVLLNISILALSLSASWQFYSSTELLASELSLVCHRNGKTTMGMDTFQLVLPSQVLSLLLQVNPLYQNHKILKIRIQKTPSFVIPSPQ